MRSFEFWVFFFARTAPGPCFSGCWQKGRNDSLQPARTKQAPLAIGPKLLGNFQWGVQGVCWLAPPKPTPAKKSQTRQCCHQRPGELSNSARHGAVFCLFARVDQDSSWRIGRKGVKPFLFKSRAFHSIHSRTMHLLGLVALPRPPIHPFACFPLQQSLACICCVAV